MIQNETMKDKARQLMVENTKDLKKRQASMLERTAEELEINVDAENITLNQGKVQSTMRKTLK